jgi:tetratricopeptide (TPR) repeat protein
MKRFVAIFFFVLVWVSGVRSQINTDHMMTIGRNSLYFEDYVLSIQYFNTVIKAKPYLAEPYYFRALAKFYLEDYAGAGQDFTLALDRNAFLVKAYVYRGYARLSLGDFEGAISDCNRGFEFDQQNKSLLYVKGYALVSAKKYDDAQVVLEEMIQKYPKEVAAYMAKGVMNLERGDTLAAIEDFSRSIAVDRFYAKGWAARGEIFLMKDNYVNALADLNEAIRLKSDDALYYMNRAVARHNLNDLRGTMEDFDKSISLDPTSKLSYVNRAILRTTVGDLNRALEDYDKVLSIDPADFQVLFNRALVRKDLGKFKDAIADFSAIIVKYPNFTPAYYKRSDAKRALGDAKGADRDYFAAYNIEEKLKSQKRNKKQIKSTVPDDTIPQTFDFTKYKRMIAGKSKGNPLNEYQNPMRGKVQDQTAEIELEHLYRVTYYEKMSSGPARRGLDMAKYIGSVSLGGKTDAIKPIVTNQEQSLSSQQASMHFASIDEYSRLLENEPKNASFYFGRSLDYALVQDLTNAMRDLDQSIELNNNYILAYFERANLRYRKMNVDYASKEEGSDLQVAVSTTSKSGAVVKKNTSDPASLTGLLSGGERAYGTDLELVLKDLEKVISLDPNFYYAYFNRGNIRCLVRDYRNALQDFTKAIETNPDFADAWFNRGITQIYLGDREHGMADLRMAGQLGNYKAYSILKSLGE